MAKKADNTHRNNLIMAIVISVLIALPAGYVLAETTDSEDDSTSTSQTAKSDGHSHSHGETYEYAAHETLPAVQIKSIPDPKGGVNVQIETQNFTFTPENASMEHVDNEGHGHIYLNGEKVGRVYGEWFHVANAVDGDEIEVTLNTNDHKLYTHDGEEIASTVTVSGATEAGESHSDDDDHSHSDGDSHVDGEMHSDM